MHPGFSPAPDGLRSHTTRPQRDTDGGATAEHATPRELLVGEQVERYQIRKLLGQGGMGQVYLARDVMLGRSVAIKVVRPERVGGAGGERFVQEARLLAALNHPHIVQLYDAGIVRGGPYLALEYVDGETLQQRGAAALGLDEALRLTRDIAEALVHAHAHGVLHCDLKPSNIIVGRDGRLRVVDFGLARRVAGLGAQVEGTPGWMAPEQWRGQALTDRVDVWALALVLMQLLGEPDPFAGVRAEGAASAPNSWPAPQLPTRADLPPRLVELLARSLEPTAELRPSAADWLRALEEALAGRDLPASAEGPYRGLAPFAEQHARDFFGRDAEIDAFLERLREVTLLPIVGPSGAGKSSFLFAGVIPRLRARGGWAVLSLRPGARPVETLARRLLAAGTLGEAPTLELHGEGSDPVTAVDEREVRALARELRARPALLAVRLATLAAVHRGRVLLVVDQLEELFTHGAPEDDVTALMAMLLQAADDPDEGVRVAVTVRDDFLGRLAGLRELFVMRPLGPQELRLAITAPLRRTGCAFDDPSVVDDMLAELGAGTFAELPLLQFACRALWDGRDVARRLLLRATYAQIGGVAGALARHADGVIEGLPLPEQGLARQLFVRLVVGTARRAVARSALVAELPASGAVLDRLVAARLVVQRTSAEGSSVVEIAHEALLRSWARLQGWLDESREERRLLQELQDAAEMWRHRGRRSEETWPAAEIAAIRHRLTALGLSAPPDDEDFLLAGERRYRALRRRAHRRLALAAVSAAAVTTLSILLAGQFRRQKQAAEQQAEALRLAGSNLGQVELALAPFDWAEGREVPVPAAQLPALSWRVFGARPGDPHNPGEELPAPLVRRLGTAAQGDDGTRRVERVELPGGTAFLRIDGRGRAGQRCAPSWIRLQALPGYAARQQPARRLELPVPTCAASAADMVEIEAGPFIYGGPGEPAVPTAERLEPEQVLDLPQFSMDRTEVSNARFAPFARMREVTGYEAPAYPHTEVHAHAGEPDHPLAAVDAFEAEAICRFWGKRLPGDHEWTKAARGGLTVHGVVNPAPRRRYPWGTTSALCSNDAGIEDGYRWVAPVDAFQCGRSPYGVLNLAGNVSEWISRERQTDRAVNPLWVIRGGDANTPASLGMSTTVHRNEREGRQFTFSIGLRCVSEGK